MNESQDHIPADDRTAEHPVSHRDAPRSAHPGTSGQLETWRWWVKLLVQPSLLLVCGATLIAGLGVAQRLGLVSASGGGVSDRDSAGASNVQYICPMMCTPPQTEPGRCPVCAMELVQAAASGGGENTRSIQIDPAARRVANIQTVAVQSMSMQRSIRAVGQLNYDEGTLKTLSAYVDGRIEQLYADYTGAVVEQGDHLALVYSPRLYTAQVELLLARKAHAESRSEVLQRIHRPHADLYDSAKQQLIELGMTASQIEQLERAGRATSRMHLCAPVSGTVIEKLAVEGEYVKEGQPIYKLADLSTVWLMLELFPEDAATVRYGQRIDANVQSLPGESFTGRVAFIDPNVDQQTRTVGVRVVVPNPDGRLRVGDYAKATIAVPVGGSSTPRADVYDPDLADKWISPRHPHVIADSAGQCPLCGVDLVPAVEFGFVSEPAAQTKTLVVPRDAVLMAGNHSVVYVEIEAGRFELRPVVLGPACGDQFVVLSGVELGEFVATRGNFLIDSQMQLAGNPSLIDPLKATPSRDESPADEMMAIELPPMGVPEFIESVSSNDMTPALDLYDGLPGPSVLNDSTGSKAHRMDLETRSEQQSGLPPMLPPQAIVPTEVVR